MYDTNHMKKLLLGESENNLNRLKIRALRELFEEFSLSIDQKIDISEALYLTKNESGVQIVKAMFKERYSKLCKLPKN